MFSSDGTFSSTAVTVTDVAGNTSAASNVISGINIDKTAPVVTASRDHAANANNWYKDNVVVSFSASDSLSGVASTASPVTLSAEAAGQSASGSATDLAGNVGSVTESGINIDKTAPSISGSRSPAANSFGWNNGAVTVSFSGSDALSGVASVSAPTTLSAEGASQSVTGTVTDKAGNSTSATVSDINIDLTKPTISAAATTSPNAAGWYNSNVTVHFSTSDALSGINTATIPADQVLSSEGSAVSSMARTVCDKAGNQSDPSNVVTVKIDKTAPQTTPSYAAANAAGWYNASVSVSLAATDNLSGVSATEYRIDGGAWTTYGGAFTVTGDAIHTVDFRSTDVAGNGESVQTRTIKIDTTAPGLTFGSPQG